MYTYSAPFVYLCFFQASTDAKEVSYNRKTYLCQVWLRAKSTSQKLGHTQATCKQLLS